MKLISLYLFSFSLLNAFFSFGMGYIEAILDDSHYGQEKIAGFKKHPVYVLTRGCFWTVVFMCLILFWKDDFKILAINSILLMGSLLLQFKFFHDGAYHIFRNRMNPYVSQNKFFDDGDGKSGSFMDSTFGHTYLARLTCLAGSAILEACLFGYNLHLL